MPFVPAPVVDQLALAIGANSASAVAATARAVTRALREAFMRWPFCPAMWSSCEGPLLSSKRLSALAYLRHPNRLRSAVNSESSDVEQDAMREKAPRRRRAL